MAERTRPIPALLLLRRYLKLAIEMCEERLLTDTPLAEAPELPFVLSAIPRAIPPCDLQLWVMDLSYSP